LTATWGSVGAVGDVITWTSTTEPDSTLLLPLEEVTVTYRVQIVEDVSKNARFTNTAQITGAGSLVMAQAPAQAITAFYMYLPIFIRNYPPVPIINAIPAPVNAAYTVSWTEIQTEFDYYELEQSLAISTLPSAPTITACGWSTWTPGVRVRGPWPRRPSPLLPR
jgi:hypothetical protein